MKKRVTYILEQWPHVQDFMGYERWADCIPYGDTDALIPEDFYNEVRGNEMEKKQIVEASTIVLELLGFKIKSFDNVNPDKIGMNLFDKIDEMVEIENKKIKIRNDLILSLKLQILIGNERRNYRIKHPLTSRNDTVYNAKIDYVKKYSDNSYMIVYTCDGRQYEELSSSFKERIVK